MKDSPDGSIQSVRRSLRILSLFTPAQPEWAVGDIARKLGFSKSVVSRLLATMAREGFVVQDPADRSYGIGPQAFAVGAVYQPFLILEKISRPVMEELARSCGHSACLGVPSGDVFTVIDTIQSTGSVRVAFEVGQRPHYHSAAIGKLLLASLAEARVREIVGPDPLPQLTPHTIGTFDRLTTELEHIRRAGIAVSRQETYIGVGAVAAGIVNSRGTCIAGLSVVYPFHMVSDEEIQHVTEATSNAARCISEQLDPLSLQRRSELRSITS